MAFISMTRQKAPYRYASKTRLSIRRTDSGSAGCYVTVAVQGKQEFIIAELDSEARKIRLKLTDSYEEGVRLSSGTFTLPARFCREILPDDVRNITILLEKATMSGCTGATDMGAPWGHVILTPSRCSVVQPRGREKAIFPRSRRFRYYLVNGICHIYKHNINKIN